MRRSLAWLLAFLVVVSTPGMAATLDLAPPGERAPVAGGGTGPPAVDGAASGWSTVPPRTVDAPAERETAPAPDTGPVLVGSSRGPILVGTIQPADDRPGDHRYHPHAIASPPALTNNTTARLVLPFYQVTRSEYETVRLGIGTTLDVAVGDVRDRHGRLWIEAEFEAAESLDEQRNAIDRSLIRLEARVERLQARERTAIRNYSDGNISVRTLVHRLATIDAEARRLERTLEYVEQLSSRAQAPWFQTRIDRIDAGLALRQGPVRQRAARALAGEVPPQRIYVKASDEGLVLAMLVEDRFVREVYYGRNRAPNSSIVIENIGAAGERATELYPWAFNNSGSSGVQGLTPTIYRIQVPHTQGLLVAYLDAGSADVFREVQQFRVGAMPTEQLINTTNESLHLTVARTYPSGPMRITVRSNATGVRVNASVAIDGTRMGATGLDGTLWVIEPRVSYTINVTRGDSQLNVTVRTSGG